MKLAFMKCAFIITLILVGFSVVAQNNLTTQKSLKVAVIGLVHTHVHWILGRDKLGDIEIVGIVEPNRKLAQAYSKQHGFSMEIVFNTMEELMAKTKPEAVFAFNTIYDHLKTVEFFAPRGIHVMVEKPLAVNLEHAEKMIALSKKYHTYLLTNYETTWYGSNKVAWQIINDSAKIGTIHKMVFHTGHQGPIEIGCNPEFLEWLTDPVLNGGGALTDFGCYGANLATWFMKGEHPLTVTAITQHFKPWEYPKVEDEGTILLTYPTTQVIIQASWNWPYSRKDMEVYGQDGYVFCLDKENMFVITKDQKQRESIKAEPLPAGVQDPFMYFANLIKGNLKIGTYDLSSSQNNEIVMKILEASKQSVKTGKTIQWNEFYKK